MRIFLILVLFYSTNLFAAEFKVAIRELEGDIKPANFQYLGVAFVLRQLHEPLFIRSNTGITSNILNKWISDSEHKNYLLCIKENIRFSNGEFLTPSILVHNLKRLNKLGFIRHKIISIKTDGKCVKISFNRSYYGFLEETQSTRTSIIDPSSENKNIPIGISVYYVNSYIPGKKLLLKTAKHVIKKPVFDTISIDILGTQKVTIPVLTKYHEINLLFPNQIPSEKILIKHFDQHKVFDLVNTYVLVNNKDLNIRKAIINCLNRKELASSIGREVRVILDGMVPNAVSKGHTFKQKCTDSLKLKQKKEVTFYYYWNPRKVPAIEKVLSQSLSKYNISVKVVHIKKSQAVKYFESTDKKYDAMIVNINGLKVWNYMHVLGLADKNKRVISFNIENRKHILEMLSDGNRAERYKVIKQFFNKLKKQYHVVPIAENARKAYYPKGLVIYNNSMNHLLCVYQVKDLSP